MAELRLEALAGDQLDAIVRVHVRAFPDSAITAFGTEAATRYYRWLIEGPHDAAVVGAWHGSQLVGFCAAGVFRGAMSGFLRANRRYLAARIATRPWLALNPLIRDRIATALKITVKFSALARRVDRSTPSTTATPAPPRAYGVLSIATDPSVRGTGAGRALMLDAEQRARDGGFARMALTVHPTNTRAVRFYEQLGWTRRVVPGSPWTGSMERHLTSPPR